MIETQLDEVGPAQRPTTTEPDGRGARLAAGEGILG
jgi:hypothetical protein